MASIELIKASDGSGNAEIATVQTTRAALASTIIVDTVAGINPTGFAGTMGTPHTFTDPVTSEEITVISEATAVDFFGHVDGSNLEIDTIAPGYTDLGSAVGDIIVIRPTTQYADEIAKILEVAHADDGTIEATSPKIITGINDTNGNELLKLTPTASAVNEATLKNAATGNAPEILASGGDTNIDLKLTPKGTGRIILNGAGAPATATVNTQELTTSSSFANLATTTDTVTVTIGASGLALVSLACRVSNPAGAVAIMGVDVSGANTIAATDNFSVMIGQGTVTVDFQASNTRLLTGLTAGSTTFKLKYRSSSGSNTGWSNRNITVIPL